MLLACFTPHRHTLWVWKGLHFRQFAVFFVTNVELANFNKDCVALCYFVGFVRNLLVSIFRGFGKLFFRFLHFHITLRKYNIKWVSSDVFSLSYLFDRDPGTGGTGANSQLKDELLGCIKLKIAERSSYVLLLCWDTTRTKSLLFARERFL